METRIETFMDLVPSLDLCRGRRHRFTVMNAVEGNLLNAGQDVLERSGDGGTTSIDGVRSRVRL